MYRGLRTEVQRLTLVMGFSGVIGWLSGELSWCVVAGGGLYSLFLLRQMQRFYVWLSRYSDAPPPSGSGIWGDIFDAIYRMRKQQARQQDQVMQQLTRMQESTAALKDGVVLLDRSGQINFWNDAAGRLLGLRRETDENQLLTNLLRDPAFARYYQQPHYPDPLILHSPLDSDGFLEIQINVFGEGEKLMVVRDITRLHKLEKIRSDFVANVSHELRTPLTVLRGYLESMADHRETLPPTWHKAIDHMQQQAGRMQHLVDDLTLLSRLESRHHELRSAPVAIDQLASRLCDDARRLSPAHRLVTEGPALQLLGNEGELHSAFGNLVTNAVRYSAAGSLVTLRWGANRHGAFFSVTDEGQGIAPIHIPRLTERFYRVDNGRGRGDGGTGLGLAIVKHALARHGGQLDIVSEPGKGSTFTCRFPPDSVVHNNQAIAPDIA